MKRKQFTFYRSFYENIERLPTNKEKLQAYQLICGYGLNQEALDLESKKPTAVIALRFAQPVLDAAHKRAEKASAMSGCDEIL